MTSRNQTTRLAIACLGAAVLTAAPAAAQAQVKAVQANPNDTDEVWALNRENNSVSVIDVTTGTVLSEITTGVFPRSIAFNADGTKALIANQRGNVPIETNTLTPFTGTEIRGSVTVVDVASRTVDQTLTGVGVEPYGLALSPNGKYFVLTSQRSGDVRFFDASTLAELVKFTYNWNLNHIPAGLTVADLDQDFDGIADYETPRGFAITPDSTRVFMTHLRSPWISVLDVTLDGSGLPTAVALTHSINQDTYTENFHPILHPTPVQTIESQGTPRFSGDIALSPDGITALIPSSLHNLNHDVNHDFGPGLAGDFANRVYPALTVIDTDALSYAEPGDASKRLEHELFDPADPAEFVSFGPQGRLLSGGIATLGGEGAPLVGGAMELRLTGAQSGDFGFIWFSAFPEVEVPLAPFGTLLVLPDFIFGMTPSGAGELTANIRIPNNPGLAGQTLPLQAAKLEPGGDAALSNGLRAVFGTVDYGIDKMGRRGGLPSKALFNPAGDRVLMLNRGSEDIFIYSVDNGDYELMGTFPPRHDFVERAPFDLNTPMGDQPLGWNVVDDPSTTNDDARIFVMNETSTSLSVLRVDWTTGVITQEHPQIPTLIGPDLMTPSERLGQEIFEDASRAQTTGAFNNSCGSCHYEGGEDGNIWQRPAGPRTTMPMYGGQIATGLLLWKGARINVAETGPMFGGENGGHGIFTDVEQQALNDFHPMLPVPLNPNIDEVTGTLTPQAALGRDLFFGTNLTGLNMNDAGFPREAGCDTCHTDMDENTGDLRGFTTDFLSPTISETLDFGFTLEQGCNPLKENINALALRNINSGANLDEDGDGFPDPDRNFDGFSDIESYAVMNPDAEDPFIRDDPNSYLCPEDPDDPNSPLQSFSRDARQFSVPTKLGVFSTGPYMHDNSMISLRNVLDPQTQLASDPVYGSANYPTSFKFYNEFHDIRGHEDFVPLVAKVQLTLQSPNIDDDIEAILAYIESL